MTALALIAATLGVWICLVAVWEWRFRPTPKTWEHMEDMINEGAQTSLRFLAIGIVSIVLVFAVAIGCGLI